MVQSTPTPKRKRTSVPENESKADKFRRLATSRTRVILKQLKLIGNLSTSQYEKTPKQVEDMQTAISTAFTAAFEKLLGKGSVSEEFSL